MWTYVYCLAGLTGVPAEKVRKCRVEDLATPALYHSNSLAPRFIAPHSPIFGSSLHNLGITHLVLLGPRVVL